jgi:type IV pilus assembly protein PilE
MSLQQRTNGGFTLIEMLIAVVVIGILAAIAVPSYQSLMERSRRGDAVSSLMRAQLSQEKHRADDIDYGAIDEIWSGTDSISGHYSIAVASNSAAAFLVTAAPKPGGLQAGDSCGTFAINQDGPFHTGYASVDCWGR